LSVRSPFVERPQAVGLVFVEGGGVRYVLTNLGLGFAVPAVLATAFWGFLCVVWVARYFGAGNAWQAFLAGALIAAVVSAAVSLAAGTAATGHVLRVEFAPPEGPERVRLVRPVGSAELPLADLTRVVVTQTEEQPYGPDDEKPAESLGVEVELRTAAGTVRSPGRIRLDAGEVVARLSDLLGPAGVRVERRDVTVTRRPPPLPEQARDWPTDDRVAGDWGVPAAGVPVLATLLQVRRAFLGHSLTSASVTHYDPADVARVTAAIADGTMARAAAGELLVDLESGRRPFAPRARPGGPSLVAFVPGPPAEAYRAAAGAPDGPEVDRARRHLALAVLGEPDPAGPVESGDLDELVRRALRARPFLPFGTAGS
jgi:hypothetical protein